MQRTVIGLGALVLISVTLGLFSPGTKPIRAGGPLPFPSGSVGTSIGRLLSCPNYNGSDNNKVDVNDVTAVVNKFRADYPDTLNPNGQRYWFMMDAVGSGGLIRVDDVTWVVNHYNQICPVLDTQIAKATQAIANPNYLDKLCDDQDGTPYQTAVNCGGDAQFLIENTSFLASKGYLTSQADVPGQGVHYAKFGIWDGVYNPVRPEGLVYKDGRLAAQLYFASGDVVGWGPDRNSNKHAVNTDALPCVASGQEPQGVGCGWDTNVDGWHWHENLCEVAIGTPQAQFLRTASQQACADTAAGLQPPITCTFPPSPGFNCIWNAAIGWMGHLWDWYPNVNFTNAVNPGPGGLNDCQTAYCATGESNGRFADCFPDAQGWNAYSCPS